MRRLYTKRSRACRVTNPGAGFRARSQSCHHPQYDVHNRVADTRKCYSAEELEQAANLLNRNYAGEGLETIHQQLISEMIEARNDMNKTMARALEMSGQVIGSGSNQGDYVMAWQINLMDFSELSQMDHLRQLLDSVLTKSISCSTCWVSR